MKIFGYISVIIFLFIISCSSNDKQEENQTEESQVEETVSEDTDEGNVDAQAGSDYEYDSNSNTEPEANESPKIKQITVETVSNNFKDGFRALVASEDPEGDAVEYIYQWKHNDSDIVGATEETLSWSDEFKKGDKISIEVVPYDDFAQGVWRSEGSFNIPNSPPKITSQPSGAVSNGTFTYSVEASDPDEDNLTYSLKDAPEGMKISDNGEITWQYTGDDAGDYNIVIVVNDGDGGETYQELSIKIEAQS